MINVAFLAIDPPRKPDQLDFENLDIDTIVVVDQVEKSEYSPPGYEDAKYNSQTH